MTSFLINLDPAIISWISSSKTLYISWEFRKRTSFITIHFMQYSLNYIVGLLIGNLIAIYKAFIKAYLSNSDIVIVDNRSTVMLYKVFNGVRSFILVVDSRRAGMWLKDSDSRP